MQSSQTSDEPLTEPAIAPENATANAQEKQRVPENCTKAFDSVYFCYSPFHQGREYYITGHLDDCRGRLKRFRMCMMSRFRPESESARIYAEEEEKEKKASGMDKVKPVWELREEYLENVRRATEEEDRDAEKNRDSAGTEKWWL